MFQKAVKSVFDFYLYSNLHVGICAIALAGTSQIIFGFNLRPELFIFIFCGTLFLYNLQRLPSAFQKVKIETKFSRHKWNVDHRYFLAAATCVAALAACWSFFHLYFRSQIIALLPGMFSVAYDFPILRINKKWKRLREIPSAKIFIVSLVWGMTCVLLPATASDPTGTHWLSLPLMIWLFSFCAMIFAHTIPFDIRDHFYDGQKLKTIPALVGIKKSIVIALLSLALFPIGFFFLLKVFSTGTLSELMAVATWSVIVGIFIIKSNPKRNEYYFSFLGDGLIILLWFFVFAANSI